MGWNVIVHQKDKAPDLVEKCETEEEAKATLKDLAEQVNQARGSAIVVSSKSGRIAFKVGDFNGVVLREGM